MVLVVGAAGAYGSAVVRALVAQGRPVRALVRRPMGIPGVPDAEIRVCDASSRADVLEHSEGCDVVVHALNLPWAKWDPALLALTNTLVEAALDRGATLVFPTTVDPVKPIFDVPLPVPPPRLDINDFPVKKGEFRAVLEARVLQMSDQLGGRVIIVRCNDFFGPGVVRRPFGPTQTALLKGGAAPWYGPLDAPRALTFVEDAATLSLAAVDAVRPDFVELVAPCHVRTAAEWAKAFGGAGTPTVRPKWQVSLRGLVDAEDREQVELMYNWSGPILFKDDAVRALLPDWAPVSFDEAIARTRAGVA